MSDKKRLVLSFLTVSSSALMASSAFAYTIPMHCGQQSVVGLTQAGVAYIATERSPGGPCDFTHITTSNGNLTANITISGNYCDDKLLMAPSWGVSYCGQTWTPIRQNGFTYTVSLGGGNDGFVNWDTASVRVDGQDGNDALWNMTSTSAFPTVGGNGDDTFYGFPNNYLDGGSGSDAVCTGSNTVYAAFGGADYDELCGSASHHDVFETYTCDFRCGY